MEETCAHLESLGRSPFGDYVRDVRGFLIVTAAVFIAIAVGVAVESSSPSAVPLVLAQAIARTIAVRSAEVAQTFPLPNPDSSRVRVIN